MTVPQQFQQKPLLGKIRLTSTLVVETGLHIGGGGQNLDIGGLDKPVIRDPLTQQPYLPGSSLKGKLRAILERLFNKPLNRSGGSDTFRYESDDLEDGYTEVKGQLIPYQGARTCPISRLFGSTGTNCWILDEVAQAQDLKNSNTQTRTIQDKEYTKIKGRNAPARLIVRDCHLQPESAEKLKKIDTGLFMTEWKFENGIDRVTAAANPRQLERVPKGSQFDFEIVYTVEDINQAVEDLQNIAVALAILEDDALGGHGSRGYGKISLKNFSFESYDYEGYRREIDKELQEFRTTFPQPPNTINGTQQLLEEFSNVQRNLLPNNNTGNVDNE